MLKINSIVYTEIHLEGKQKWSVISKIVKYNSILISSSNSWKLHMKHMFSTIAKQQNKKL